MSERLDRRPARAGRISAFIALAITGLTGGAAIAASPSLHFARVGSEGGPPPDVVTALHQDRAGFLWIGSRDSLFRYDGRRFLSFEHDPGDPASISDHVIRTIFEDRDGNLWFGTNAGGLNRLDPAGTRFRSFRHDPASPDSLSHDSVYAIAQEPGGTLWVATQRGLNRLAPGASRFDRFLADATDATALGGDYVTALLVDRQGRLWAGTNGGGLSVREPGATGFRTYRRDPEEPGSLCSDQVFALHQDAEGRIWVGTQDGLCRRDDAADAFVLHPLNGEGTPGERPLVTFVTQGTSGRLWIGTFGDGLVELDPGTDRVRRWGPDPSRPDSLASDRVLALLVDRAAALWVGTWGGGLQRAASFTLERASRAHPDSAVDLAGGPVGALLADHAAGLWIGTLSGRLDRRAPDGTTRTWLPGGPASRFSQILSLLEDREGRIWVGTSTHLHRITPATGDIESFHHDPADPASLGPGYVRALYLDRSGRVWAGTGEGGAQRLAEDGHVERRLVRREGDPETLSDDYVVSMAEDVRGRLWVGTRSGGLNGVDLESGRVIRYLPDADDPRSLGHHTVTSMLADDRGRLWIGTGGGGLHLLHVDGERVSFDHFTEADGLVDDDVMALLPDDDGSLWISTRAGLSRFTPEDGGVANYRVSDGLAFGEFEIGAAARAGGTLYFGGSRGVVGLVAGSSVPPASPVPTLLSSVDTPSGPAPFDRAPWELSRLTVPYGEWLRLELVVLDFGPPDRHRYAYHLGADDEPWVELGTQNSVTFTDLPPGVHRFRARGRSDQGNWTETPTPLEIRVIPPFWMTSWFRLTMVGGVALVAFGAHRLRTTALERRNRDLVALQRERETVQEDLRRAYDRLRMLTRRLEGAREDERCSIARELHDDLGPALTAVAINLQLLAQGSDPTRAADRLADSTELVDRMTQRVRDLSLGLRPPLLDEMGLVPALKGYLENEAERTGLQVEVRGDEAIAGLPAETEITAFRVVQEAVTNVVRHARAKRVEVAVERHKDRIGILVRDDGIGFDAAAMMQGAASGKALGLLGMQERVQILGGDFELTSAPGRGTRLRAHLPLEGSA